MKNEDKIVELMSIQIHKLDSQEQLLKRLVKAVDDLTEVIDKSMITKKGSVGWKINCLNRLIEFPPLSKGLP